MKDRFDKVDESIKILDQRLDGIDKHLAVYNEQLTFHIERTNKLEEKFEPVEKHVALVNAGAKIIGGLVFLGGAILLVMQLLGKR